MTLESLWVHYNDTKGIPDESIRDVNNYSARERERL